jgi:putative ABC transport system permease protein
MKRLYRILLRIYPAGFREEFATELERQFSDEYREAKGRRERILLGLRALTDLAATAPAEIARELRQDLRYAARIYRQRPVATALALAALALAIGTTTGIFSVLNALLIRSLPFREPERLVELWKWPMGPLSGRNAVDAWRSGSQYFEDVAFFSPQPMNLNIGSESLRVTVCESTANFLRMLGTEPELGRGFSSGEDIPGKNRVAVIGYGLWQQAFGGDSRAMGSIIRLNGAPLTVVGVAARNFDFPEKTVVWTPTAYGSLPSTYWINQTIGRIKPGVSFDQASAMYRADVDRVTAGRPNAKVESYLNNPRLIRLQDRLAGPVRTASLTLMGMMAFVLLIACANLAHLLLSRAAERRHELAIRAALGASRARLTRQLITEATVLTAAAAIAGLAVAQWTARLAGIAQPAQLASRQYSVLDWRVVAFALGLAAVTGIVFGVLPASLIGRMQPSRQDAIGAQPGSRGSGASRMRGVLIALQVTLTVALAAGSFSMGHSFLRLLGIDLGYRTSGVVTLNVSFPRTQGRTAPFSRQALERLRAVPGVESAGAASYLPLINTKVQEGTFFKLDSDDPKRSAHVMAVSPDYFGAMGTPLIEGREFAESDRRGGAPVVIVNEKFARTFPNQKLVGRRLYLEPARVSATIVGVVRSQRFLGPESETWDVIFRPLDQYEQWAATFVAKVHGDPERYLAACRDAVQGTDRGVPVFDVKTLDQRLADALARPRFYTTAIIFLAGFTLLVAAIGAYGAASHSVSQRRHEIGIRIAVGGPPGRVRGMVFRQNIGPVCAGLVAGLSGAAELGRFLKHLMASAEPVGIWMCGSAALTIATATAFAIWTATSRVVRADPTAALRVE